MQLKGVATRSTPSSTVDDQQITDMWVLQFDNSGTFLRKSYSHNINPAAFEVSLVPNVTGATSNIYFIANSGSQIATPANEAAFKTQVKAIASETDLMINGSVGKKSIPMFGQLLTQTVPANGYITTMNVTMTRMLAQVDFTYTVDASITSSFTLEQARMCNVPTSMQYYTPGTGNFPATPSSTTVINLPLETATAPGPTTVTFYLPDNRRGVGTNTAGTNERLKSGVDYATYIELIGHTTTGAPDVDEVRYRIYPGVDNYNDYNIVRNTRYSLSTTLKGILSSDSRVYVVGKANCCMLKPGGYAYLSVKRANESALGTQIADVSTGWKAAINWQTAAELVKLDYSTYLSSGFFKVTAPSTTAKGNAEVVVTDAAGTNVLWSWHIWVTDYDPAISNDVLNGNTWMQYNLGATAPANGSNSFATSGGLMYQWGRKDPFPNSNTVGDNGAPIALSGFTMPAYSELATTAVTNDTYVKYADVSQTAIGYASQLACSVKYPMLFLANWAGSTATATAYSNVAGGLNAWGGEYGDQKSVYDPCSKGWRVPSGKKSQYYLC